MSPSRIAVVSSRAPFEQPRATLADIDDLVFDEPRDGFDADLAWEWDRIEAQDV